MSLMRSLVLSLCLITFACAQAADRDFNQERFITKFTYLLTLASFDNRDMISAYNNQGIVQWAVNLPSKVISWQLRDNRLYVFSQSRLEDRAILTCIDPGTGFVIWER